MFNLLGVLSLLACNAYGVTAVTLDSSMLTQLGYNNQSLYIEIGGSSITDIDPNAFKGYTKMTYLYIYSSSLLNLNLGVFNDSLNLQTISFRGNPLLTELINTKKIVFPFMSHLYFETPVANLDSNVTNAFPNLTSFYYTYENQLSPLKPNQLSPWKKLQTMDIKTKNQSSLTKDHFNGLNSLIELSIRNSNIKTVEVHTLTLALPNVGSVDFSNNDITAFEYLQIPPHMYRLVLSGNKMNYFMLSRTMGFLTSLRINNNLFRSFKSMDFTFLANLTDLDLSNNPHAYPYEIGGHMKPLVNLYFVYLGNLSINTIDTNFFKYNTKLHYIYLDLNNISIISYNAFVNLKALVNIYLSNNQISFLDNRTFVGLDNLERIDLRYNKFTKIPTRTFYNLSIECLYLGYNLISEIESYAFSGSYRLNLELDHNQISKLWPRSFVNLTLMNLILSYNRISELDNSTFNGLIVDKLDLSYNNISRLGPGLFINVVFLILSNNRLTKLDNGTFVGPNNLISIDFGSNMISTIEAGAFNGLTNLREIDLSNNSISSVEAGRFNVLTNVYSLSLCNNSISTIEAGTFNGLSNLENIYLDGNNLTQLDNSTFAGCNNLQGIYLANNPNLITSNVQSLCPTTAVYCQVYLQGSCGSKNSAGSE